MNNFIYFLLGFSISLNILLIIIIAIALRIKFIDCGNIFDFFKKDKVVSNVIAKTILDDDY